ncbi:hypothetical protein [Streptomyces sp. NPDC007007]|uniref:hypothetical protein n=1 Tax=Streptomyces sp. NPDC007007 TaxID=3364770 RepID=UPI0036C5A6B2
MLELEGDAEVLVQKAGYLARHQSTAMASCRALSTVLIEVTSFEMCVIERLEG